MDARNISVFHQQFLDSSGISEVVSAPIPVSGNTARMVLELYSSTGSEPSNVLTALLEGSVLGQSWDPLSPITGGAPSKGVIGGSANNYTLTHGMVRVRVQTTGTVQAWFDVGLSFTQQG